MGDIIIRVTGLTLETNQHTIIRDVSFDIHRGEILALTGRSGSGKTSIALALLNLLPDNVRQSSGTIQWLDSGSIISLPGDNTSWKALLGSRIGFVQQDVFGAFDPVLTMGRQMILLLSEKLNQSHEVLLSRLTSLMPETGLHDTDRLLSSYPHQLSGGQLQRCMIAMIMTLEPVLVILDEPTSAIDKINQRDLLDVLARLRKKYNLSILCITHEDTVVRYLADREINLEHTKAHGDLYAPMSNQPQQISGEVVLQAEGLRYHHRYGGIADKSGATIGDLDFILRKGQCIGIVGESGSGKSTLAQILVGLLKPQHGVLTVKGNAIHFGYDDDLVRLRNVIQLVMQDGRGSLHPFFDIKKLLEEVPSVSMLPDDERKRVISKVLKDVGLTDDVQSRKPAQLSGGECLRVSIGRALLMAPEILICDESTSGLDTGTRDGIVDLLSRLKVEKQLSLILISHDESLIQTLSDEVIVMAGGKIVEKGATREITRYPTHEVSRRIFEKVATNPEKGRP